MAYNFDDLVSGASNVFDKISGKVVEAVDYSKTQIDKASLRSKIKEKYSEIGRLYYESVDMGVDKAFAINSLVGDVKELKKQLDSPDQDMDTKRCKYCQTIASLDSSFCPKCGEPL